MEDSTDVRGGQRQKGSARAHALVRMNLRRLRSSRAPTTRLDEARIRIGSRTSRRNELWSFANLLPERD